MVKQIKFKTPGLYSGYNGTAKLHGIEVADTSLGGIIISPVNSKGPTPSTYLALRPEDVRPLIAVLKEVSQADQQDKPLCEIINGRFSWILKVDGKTISFNGSSNAEYFAEIYTSKGYEVKFSKED